MINLNDDKKIAFVSHDLTPGGAERVITVLANEFSKHGYVVKMIIMSDNPTYSFSLDESIELIVPQKIWSKFKLIKKIQQIFYLRKKFKDKKIEKIISFITEPNITSIIANIGLRSKLIVSERNNPYLDPTSRIWRILRDTIYNFPSADGYVFQTQDAKMYFSKKIQHKSTIIHNPLNPMLPARKKSVNKIVSIGRLVEQKNHALLIKAFAKVIDLFPNTELHIYGNGPLKLELENLARKLNVYEKVFINNAIPDVLSKVSDAKLFVLSSNYEGMPNVLIEMMAIGIPVIATDCPIGGPREIIEDGINGLLVPVNDTTELSKKIIQIIDDKEFAKELTKESIKVREKLNVKRICYQWESFIDRI